MRRRAFIAGLSGAAVWPLLAHGQKSAVPIIGFLHSQSFEQYATALAGFRRGLADSGYIEGESFKVEYRWANGDFDRLPRLAAELLGRPVDLLVGGGGDAPALVAKSMTNTLPIVFVTGGDPIAGRMVTSLSRPDGNVTGVTFFTTELGPKRVELLRQLAPGTTRIAVLSDPTGYGADTVEAALKLGKQTSIVLRAGTKDGIEIAFATFVQEQAQGLVIVSHPFFTNQRDLIVSLANRYKIPGVYPLREYALAEGLASYGTSISDAYRQAGVYAARILSGAKPQELPVLQPTRFELVINLKTAKALGIEISPSLLARADEVIE